MNKEILEGCRRELLRVFILSIGASELQDVCILWNSPAVNSSRMCSDIFLKSMRTIGLGFPEIPMAFEVLWPKLCPGFMGRFWVFLILSAIQFHCGCVMKSSNKFCCQLWLH